MNITDIIKPINLKSGTHADTAQTGQGCFMNVIAYLNGESQITDQSPCVCVTIRQIAIFANDFLKDDERDELIPYIERAMGSATTDRPEILRRLDAVVIFANKQKDIAAKYATADESTGAAWAAEYTTKSAAAYTTKSTKWAAECAADATAYAAVAAKWTTKSVGSHEEIKLAIFEFMNTACPKVQEFSCEIIERAEKFVKITEHAVV